MRQLRTLGSGLEADTRRSQPAGSAPDPSWTFASSAKLETPASTDPCSGSGGRYAKACAGSRRDTADAVFDRGDVLHRLTLRAASSGGPRRPFVTRKDSAGSHRLNKLHDQRREKCIAPNNNLWVNSRQCPSLPLPIKKEDVVASTRGVDPALKRSMDDSLKAYAAGDARFFDYLDDEVRVYTLDSTEPILGRKRFQDYFGETFAGTKRDVVQLHQDLRATGDQAVLSQTLRISSNGVGVPVRQTIVWAKSTAGWRMTHVHNGRAGEPLLVGKAPRTARGLRVLNERIATVAATVGVAQ